MLCYRDMTFCPFHSECADAEPCNRKLTPEVVEGATKWAEKGGHPVLIAQYTENPECFVEKVTK